MRYENEKDMACHGLNARNENSVKIYCINERDRKESVNNMSIVW